VNNMSQNEDLIEEYLNQLADAYTAEELCELLGLEVWDILEAFRERCIDLKWR
jgi:hypothetical protein